MINLNDPLKSSLQCSISLLPCDVFVGVKSARRRRRDKRPHQLWLAGLSARLHTGNKLLGTYHSWMLTCLTWDKMTATWQTIFSDALSWMKSFVFWFHWSLFSKCPIDSYPALVWMMACCQATTWPNLDPTDWRIYAALRAGRWVNI